MEIGPFASSWSVIVPAMALHAIAQRVSQSLTLPVLLRRLAAPLPVERITLEMVESTIGRSVSNRT